MGKQGLRLSCLHCMEGGKRLEEGNKCTRTPTLGRVVLMGPGWATGGYPGCRGSRPGAPEPAVGTEGSTIAPSRVQFSLPTDHSGRPRPYHEAEQQLPFKLLRCNTQGLMEPSPQTAGSTRLHLTDKAKQAWKREDLEFEPKSALSACGVLGRGVGVGRAGDAWHQPPHCPQPCPHLPSTCGLVSRSQSG